MKKVHLRHKTVLVMQKEGSGTTGKAAIMLRRRLIGVELEKPRYLQTCSEMEELIEKQ